MKKLLLSLLLFSPFTAASELGIFHSTYNERVEFKQPSFIARWGDLKYLWLSYEAPDISLSGQDIGAVDIPAIGVGLKHSFSEKYNVFFEFGYFAPSFDEGEASTILDGVKSHLDSRHANGFILSLLKNDPNFKGPTYFLDADYELKSGFGGRIGGGYNISEHFRATISYRFLNVDEEVDAWIGTCSWPPTSECQRWWRESNQVDLSSFEVGILYKF
jgi:hypothetical protein